MILMTRPADFEESFRAAIGHEADVESCPLLDVKSVGVGPVDVGDYDVLIFTSRTAVKHSEQRILDRNKPCYAVGPGTASALHDLEFNSVVEAGGTADRLIHVLQDRPLGRALYVSGADVTANLALLFPDQVDRVVVYETAPVKNLPQSVQRHLKSGRYWTAPFFSKKTYLTFDRLVREAGLQHTCVHGHAVAISNAITRLFALPWGFHTVAHAPDANGMYAAIGAAQ